MKGKRWAICLLLWIAGGLFVWMAGRCSWYTFQNRSLTAENGELSSLLADRNQTIDEKTEEIESLQAQLADALLPEEHLTKNGFSKRNGVYMIDTEDQLFKLWEMLREGTDVEPGVPSASASYRLRNNIELESHLPGVSGCPVHIKISEWGWMRNRSPKRCAGIGNGAIGRTDFMSA